MILHRFPVWLSRTVEKLSKSWNIRVVATTKQGGETSEPIRFLKGLPQGDALCPRLFTVCLKPIAWKISASEGYKLSKPISVKVTDHLYIGDLKVFASSESKLNCVMESTKNAMEDVGLQWNPKKCAVAHVQNGVHTHTHDALGLRADGSICISDLEEGNQYKFLDVSESVRQEERMSLECAAKEFLRRMSIIWSSPLSDHNRVTALKILFFEILQDLGLVDSVPPWYSPMEPKPVHESNNAQAFWDVPLFAEHQEVRANRVNARIINHVSKRVITLEMSCPWVTNREKKEEEKITKYGPLRWELKQKYQRIQSVRGMVPRLRSRAEGIGRK